MFDFVRCGVFSGNYHDWVGCYKRELDRRRRCIYGETGSRERNSPCFVGLACFPSLSSYYFLPPATHFETARQAALKRPGRHKHRRQALQLYPARPVQVRLLQRHWQALQMIPSPLAQSRHPRIRRSRRPRLPPDRLPEKTSGTAAIRCGRHYLKMGCGPICRIIRMGTQKRFFWGARAIPGLKNQSRSGR
jgi:hypothetical protein